MQQYTADYNAYPRPITGTAPTISWPTTLQPYVQNTQVFVCPSGEEKLTKIAVVADDGVPYCGNVEGDGSTDSVQLVPRLSYAWNAIPSGVPNAWVDPTWNNTERPKSGYVSLKGRSLSPALVRDPTGTILIADAWAGADDAANCDDGTLSNSMRTINAEARTDRYGNNTRSKVANRHDGGFNALFGDGHVKWSKWNTTTAQEWSIQAD